MIDLDYFYDEENEGALITRPQTATIEQLKQMIADGRPTKAIEAYKPFVVNGYIWKKFDDYQKALVVYENNLAHIEAHNAKLDVDGEPVEQLDLPTEPVFEPFEPLTLESVESQIEPELRAVNKAKREAELSSAVVEVDGLVFDANRESQANMLFALQVAEVTGQAETEWKLNNNEWTTVNVDQLKNVLALAGAKLQEIMIKYG